MPLVGRQDGGKHYCMPLVGRQDGGKHCCMPLVGRPSGGKYCCVPLNWIPDGAKYCCILLAEDRAEANMCANVHLRIHEKILSQGRGSFPLCHKF